MRSEAQIRASRLNGAKSRGPRRKTEPGLSARNVVLCNESHALFEQLERNFINDLKPVDVIELFLIQRMAAAQWRIYRAIAISTALLNASLRQNWQQDEAENPELDQDFRLALAYKRIAKDLVPIQQFEARMERSLDRALTAFHRLRKSRSPDAQPIEPPLTDVTTTGRDPASYFFVEGEPKPTPAENSQTPPVQSLAAAPPKSATDPEPKPKPKRCTTRDRNIRRRASNAGSIQVEFMRCPNCAPTFIAWRV
jgi:hypothetical protein